MSMYNMVNGMNTQLVMFLSGIVGRRLEKIPRFRDAFNGISEEEKKVGGIEADYYLYTRMGGGNYECWEFSYEDCNDGQNKKSLCPYHELVQEWESLPEYVGGWDDDFDCTYRTLAFNFSPEQKELFDRFQAGDKEAEELVLKRVEELYKKEEESE